MSGAAWEFPMPTQLLHGGDGGGHIAGDLLRDRVRRDRDDRRLAGERGPPSAKVPYVDVAEDADRGVRGETVTEGEMDGLSRDEGGSDKATSMVVKRRADTAVHGTGRAKGVELPTDVLIDLFESLRKVYRRTLVAASTVCRRWSAPARAALLQSICFGERDQTAFSALAAVMRKYRLGEEYASRPPLRFLGFRNTGLPPASTRALLCPLFANVRLLSIELPFDPNAQGPTRGPIDMSVLAPLLIACPHLTSLALMFTTESDFVPLPTPRRSGSGGGSDTATPTLLNSAPSRGFQPLGSLKTKGIFGQSHRVEVYPQRLHYHLVLHHRPPQVTPSASKSQSTESGLGAATEDGKVADGPKVPPPAISHTVSFTAICDLWKNPWPALDIANTFRAIRKGRRAACPGANEQVPPEGASHPKSLPSPPQPKRYNPNPKMRNSPSPVTLTPPLSCTSCNGRGYTPSDAMCISCPGPKLSRFPTAHDGLGVKASAGSTFKVVINPVGLSTAEALRGLGEGERRELVELLGVGGL
ncbi:hypothetical protein BDK51DRAFT_45134 [Blyttiomyces helicus]|uniref:F-box domain-containing protein n=1 Tax=Blyttiomyces helicus TaxID=388810 RepID=A0A4V1IS09_9FUNG|nr:hypothetical protein BDK51DRAFT_45134 [Blyttiomyces helicus]|eukprot:RKO91917.1 hypothetical protein BDK51DRAFT_45134 [Blyttiomyces helicus]